MCSSSQPSAPTSTTTQTSNIPEYARPYVETMLGATQKQLFDTKDKVDPTTGEVTGTEITGMKPYNPYSTNMNDYFAGPSPMQQQAYQGAANLGVSPQNQAATGMAAQAGLGALNASYNPAQFANQYQAPGQYQSAQFGAPNVRSQRLQTFQMGPALEAQAPELQGYQMGPAQQVGTQSFAQPGAAQDYMSPYMQNVVDVQQREARRASDVQAQKNAAQAVGQGAFGGSRAALVEAERQRNLGTQLGDIQATGQQAAYQQAQQQFNAEQQARLQAQQANQQAGLTTGQANLNALLGVQSLGAGQNLQAQLANQQAGLTTGQQNLQAALGVQSLGSGQNLQAQQLNQAAALQAQQAAEQSRQFGYGQNMAAAQLQAQYGLSADQAAEASRQFSANYGLQGLSTALNAANQLGTLGQNQYNQQTGAINLQNALGQQQQALEQSKINQAIQNYATGQQWGMQQLSNMNAMLRGLPLQTTSTATYQAAPSTASQLAGVGTALAGVAGKTAKSGGSVKNIKKRPNAGLAAGALNKVMKG